MPITYDIAGMGIYEQVEAKEAKPKENGFEALEWYDGVRFLDCSLGKIFRLASKEDSFLQGHRRNIEVSFVS